MKDKETKEQLNEISASIESEIETLEKQLAELQEKQKQNRQEEQEADKEWAQRVVLARKLGQKRNQARAKIRKMSGLSPARLNRLRQLGKI